MALLLCHRCRFLEVCKCRVRYHQEAIPQKLINDFVSIVGDKQVSTLKSVCEPYGKDESIHTAHPPDVVIKPLTTEHISNIAKLCYKTRTPMIPFGIGSGLEGGTIAVKGGVCLDLGQMNNVISLHADDFDVTVEPGISRKSLNSFLRNTGLWFPIDPGADATIGGMASTSASGTTAVRYGTMRENVLNLEVVLADGTIINTAGCERRPKKTSAGYNLTNLFVGSEGTLGIITKTCLKLWAVPEMITSAVCSFPSVKIAVSTAIQILQASIPIARVELLDSNSIRACNAYSKLCNKEAPTLFLEFHGSSNEVKHEADTVADLALSNGGENFCWSSDIEERNRLWNARHNLYYAILALRPGWKCYISDVCVPISELPNIVDDTVKDIENEGILASILGHVGDGNFHTLLLLDPTKIEEAVKLEGVIQRLNRRAWNVGGTCTGEHGIGIGKIKYLKEEIGANGYEVMKTIKKTLDPLNIMNPGKVILF